MNDIVEGKRITRDKSCFLIFIFCSKTKISNGLLSCEFANGGEEEGQGEETERCTIRLQLQLHFVSPSLKMSRPKRLSHLLLEKSGRAA
jgi:hypothetical protein